MAKPTDGFVPLTALKSPERPARDVLADIRSLYFQTTARTIEQDFAHAIALLMSLADEDDRDKAAVYMEGLTEMRSEWARSSQKGAAKRGAAPKGAATKAAGKKATRNKAPATKGTAQKGAPPSRGTQPPPRKAR